MWNSNPRGEEVSKVWSGGGLVRILIFDRLEKLKDKSLERGRSLKLLKAYF